MNNLYRFPQGKVTDNDGNVTLEWQQWLQNPQFVSAKVGSLVVTNITNSMTNFTNVCQDGEDGLDGNDGMPGKNGLNGLNGTNGFNGQDGEDGQDGMPIPASTSGYTGTLTTASLVGKTVTIVNGLITNIA